MEYQFSNISDFVNFLLGCYSRTKEIHWRTQNKATHEALDDIGWNLTNIADSVMEQALSIYGREVLSSGDVQATVLVVDTFEDLISLINSTAANFRASLEGIDEFKSLSSELDTFIFNTNISKYRGELVA